jgi:hypothetical protein
LILRYNWQINGLRSADVIYFDPETIDLILESVAAHSQAFCSLRNVAAGFIQIFKNSNYLIPVECRARLEKGAGINGYEVLARDRLVTEFQRFSDHQVEISKNIWLVGFLPVPHYIGSAMRIELIGHYICAVGQARHCNLLVHSPHSRVCFPRASDAINHHFLAGYVLIRI